MELLCERVIGLVFSFEKLHLLLTVNIFTKEKENFQSIGVNMDTRQWNQAFYYVFSIYSLYF